MKKLIIAISILLIAVLFVACNATSVRFTGTRVGCVRSEQDTNFSLSCESFNGTATYSITLTKDTGYIIDYDLVVEKGTLKLEFIDDKGKVQWEFAYEPLFNGKKHEVDYQQFAFKDKDNEPTYGRFKIKITATDFKGNYSFDWDNIEPIIHY